MTDDERIEKRNKLIKELGLGELCYQGCGGSGGVQISEDEVQQCQFCDQILYPAVDRIAVAITSEVARAVAEKDKELERYGNPKYRHSVFELNGRVIELEKQLSEANEKLQKYESCHQK